MIPKSTAKLQGGDFCWIERDDGAFVPFVYICKQKNSRSYFYGGIAKALVNDTQISSLSNDINVAEYALLHIKCFKENNTPIAGNIASHLSSGLLESLREESHKTGVGSKTNVWGYRTIYKYANAVKA